MPKSPVLTILQEYSMKTGNHCGLTVAELANRSGLPLSTIRENLRALHNQGKIKVRDGIHGKLIFLNQ